jgi:hypothetical protein
VKLWGITIHKVAESYNISSLSEDSKTNQGIRDLWQSEKKNGQEINTLNLDIKTWFLLLIVENFFLTLISNAVYFHIQFIH